MTPADELLREKQAAEEARLEACPDGLVPRFEGDAWMLAI
jgi:hypothetical protein